MPAVCKAGGSNAVKDFSAGSTSPARQRGGIVNYPTRPAGASGVYNSSFAAERILNGVGGLGR